MLDKNFSKQETIKMKNTRKLVYGLVESICALYEEATGEDLKCEDENLDSFKGNLSQDDLQIPQDEVSDPIVLDDKDVKNVKDDKKETAAEALDDFENDDGGEDDYKTNTKAKQQAKADEETAESKKAFEEYSKYIMPKVKQNFENLLGVLDKQFESGKTPKAIGKALYAIYTAGEKVANGGFKDGSLTILRMLGYGSRCCASRAEQRYNGDNASPVTYLKTGFLGKLNNVMRMTAYNELPVCAFVELDGTLKRLRVKFLARMGIDMGFMQKEDPEALKILNAKHEWPVFDKKTPGMKEFAAAVQQLFGDAGVELRVDYPYSVEFIFDTFRKSSAKYAYTDGVPFESTKEQPAGQVNEWRDGNKKKLWCAEASYDDGAGDGHDALAFIRADNIEEAEKRFEESFINVPDEYKTDGEWSLVGLNETTEEFMDEVEKEYQKTRPTPHYTTKTEDFDKGLEAARFDDIYAFDDANNPIPDFGKGSLDPED